MIRTTVRALVLAALLAMITTGCEATLRIDTRLDATGDGGTLAVAMILDDEARASFEREPEGPETLFEPLVAHDWSVRTERTEDDGLIVEASRRFSDQSELRLALDELQGARAPDNSPLAGMALDLRYSAKQSFLRRTATFEGSIDTSGGRDLDEATRQVYAELIKFEVRAQMPGSATVRAGSGTASDGTVVWRPELGRALRFEATSSGLRVGSILLLIVPLLALAGAVGIVAASRRKHAQPVDPRAERVEPQPNTVVVLEPLRQIVLPADATNGSDGVSVSLAEPERETI
ncbi:MAG TPA: hypothetical protein VM600_10095 [Actinomycetota bacterium]|nr:hypothetical protein [Actinomycetota bacterium]